MPAPPGMSDEEYRKLKKEQAKKQEMKKAQSKYKAKYDPTPKVDALDTEGVENDWMKPGDWVPAWGIVEFVGLQPALPFGGVLFAGHLTH